VSGSPTSTGILVESPTHAGCEAAQGHFEPSDQQPNVSLLNVMKEGNNGFPFQRSGETMSEIQATKTALAHAISIYDDDASIVWKALKSLAQDEYCSGHTDEELWEKAVAMEMDGDEKLPPAVSEDHVLYTAVLGHPMHKAVLDTYCCFRGVDILLEAQVYGDAELREEIIRIKEIQKLYAKPHYSPGRMSHTSRHTLKYFSALLVVILIATLLGVNGA